MISISHNRYHRKCCHRSLRGMWIITFIMAIGTTLSAPAAWATSVTATEGETMAFNIAPNYNLGQPYRWEYKTEGGTATDDKDYEAVSGHVVFGNDGDYGAQDIEVTTILDCANEADEETFNLKLYNFQVKGNTGWETPTYQISASYPASFKRKGKIRNVSHVYLPAGLQASCLAAANI